MKIKKREISTERERERKKDRECCFFVKIKIKTEKSCCCSWQQFKLIRKHSLL